MDTLAGMLPLLLLVALVLMIFQRNRSMRRQQQATQASLAPGVEVMTSSGLYGRVASVDDDVVSLEVAPSVTLRVHRQAVARVLAAPAGESPEQP